MKKRVVFMSIFTAAAFAVAAQALPGGGAEGSAGAAGLKLMPEDELALWDELLALDAEQEDAFLDLIADFGDKMAELFASDSALDRDRISTLTKERNEALASVLDQEQVAAFRAALENGSKRPS